jgi:hypothetical protein
LLALGGAAAVGCPGRSLKTDGDRAILPASSRLAHWLAHRLSRAAAVAEAFNRGLLTPEAPER